MTDAESLRRFYRFAEDFRRYGAGNKDAARRMERILRVERRRFGRSLLDLGCGGGALARAFEAPGRSYVGIDVNPDMIREARSEARSRHSTATFRRADIRRVRLRGSFDTVTLLGNALSHLTAMDLLRVLRRLEGHASPGARFVVDYRDTVRLFFDRKWRRRFVQRKGGHRVVSTTRGVDLERGEVLISARRARAGRSLGFTQTIWSPFLLEALMSTAGWKLVRRSREPRWYGWRDVYRYDRALIPRSG